MQNDLWSLAFIFKVFQPCFCSKTAKIWHFLWCPLISTCSTGWILTIFVTWSLACDILWHTMIFDLYLSSWSFSHDFAIKLLKHGMPCNVSSTGHTVLNRFFHIWHFGKNDHYPSEGVSCAMTFDFDLYLQSLCCDLAMKCFLGGEEFSEQAILYLLVSSLMCLRFDYMITRFYNYIYSMIVQQWC